MGAHTDEILKEIGYSETRSTRCAATAPSERVIAIMSDEPKLITGARARWTHHFLESGAPQRDEPGHVARAAGRDA